MTILLTTHRLILRPFKEKDILPFSLYRSDPDVARYQGWTVPFTIEQAEQFVTEMRAAAPGEPGQWYQIAIELKSNGELIGDCAFQCLAGDLKQAEIGITIAAGYQGHGYGTEAVARLLAFLFSDMGLHRVRANCDPDNTASIKLLEKVGMRHEGRFMESLWLKGDWVSEDWYAILRREWLARS